MNHHKKDTTAVAEPPNAIARNFSKAKPLAARVGVCSKTIHRLADAGYIQRFKVNQRVVLFDPDEVIRFITAAKTGV